MEEKLLALRQSIKAKRTFILEDKISHKIYLKLLYEGIA